MNYLSHISCHTLCQSFLYLLILDFVICQVPVAPKPPDFVADFSTVRASSELPAIEGEELDSLRTNGMPDQLWQLREKTLIPPEIGERRGRDPDGLLEMKQGSRDVILPPPDVVRRIPEINNLTESIMHDPHNTIEDISDFSMDSSEVDGVEDLRPTAEASFFKPLPKPIESFKQSSKFGAKAELERIHNIDAANKDLPPFAFSEDEEAPIFENEKNEAVEEDLDDDEVQFIDRDIRVPIVGTVLPVLVDTTTKTPTTTSATTTTTFTPTITTTTATTTTTTTPTPTTPSTTTSTSTSTVTPTRFTPPTYSTNHTTTRIMPGSRAFTYTTRHPSSPVSSYSGRIPNPLHVIPRAVYPGKGNGRVDSAIPQFPAFVPKVTTSPRVVLQTEFFSTEFRIEATTTEMPQVRIRKPSSSPFVIVKQTDIKRRSEGGPSRDISERIKHTSQLLNLLGDRIAGIDQMQAGINLPRTAVMTNVYNRGEIRASRKQRKYTKTWGKTTHGRMGRMTYDGQFHGLAHGETKKLHGGGYTVRKDGRYYTTPLREAPRTFTYLQAGISTGRNGNRRIRMERKERQLVRKGRSDMELVAGNSEDAEVHTQDEKNFAQALMETEEESMRQLKNTLRQIRDVVKSKSSFFSSPIPTRVTPTVVTNPPQLPPAPIAQSYKGSFDFMNR